jgi:hypothetical protein
MIIKNYIVVFISILFFEWIHAAEMAKVKRPSFLIFYLHRYDLPG